MYFFDIAFENLDLFFTFSSEQKAEKALGCANERLAEIEAAAEEKNPAAVRVAIANYESNIALATEKSKEVKDKGRAENLVASIADNISRNQEVLSAALIKVPKETRVSITQVSDANEEGQEQIAELKGQVEKLRQELADLRTGDEEREKIVEKLSARRAGDTIKPIPAPTPAKPITPKTPEIKPVSKPATTPSQNQTQLAEPQNTPPAPTPSATTPQNTSIATLSNSQIIKKVKPAVVYIETDTGTGSGMIIDSDGFILTNAHVVQNSATAQVTLSSGNIYSASVVGRDENVDLAVLKINVQNLIGVEFGDSNTAEQGDEVFTLGYPFGIKGDVSFKEGTISRKIVDGVNAYLETSAEIHPGNSGGPLVNVKGNVIGVNSASFGQSIKGIAVGETIKFAIPINVAKDLIPALKAGRQVVVPKTESPAVADPFQTEDSNLKIAKCQAERDSSISSFVSLTNSAVESAIATLKANAKAYVDEQLRLYDSCWFGPDKSPNPESLCRNYTDRAQAKIDQTGSLVTEMRNDGEASILQAKALADVAYNKCINK